MLLLTACGLQQLLVGEHKLGPLLVNPLRPLLD
jgi:hypothetical protein